MTFKVGDRVRVAGKGPNNGVVLGWDNYWIDDMDNEIGKTGVIVRDLGTAGLEVSMDTCAGFSYSYHPSMLELVAEEKLVKEKPVFELKPFMRVQTKARGMWLVIPTTGLTHYFVEGQQPHEFILMNGTPGWTSVIFMTEELEKDNSGSLERDYAIVKVCAPPFGYMHALDFKLKGDLLWQYESERKREIQELKEKLAQLEQEENAIC